MPMTDAPNFGTKFGWRKPCLRYIGPLLRTTSVAPVGQGDLTPPLVCFHSSVGGGLRPAPLGKASFQGNFRWFRNPSHCVGADLCVRAVGGSREGTYPGRHMGRPLQSRLQCSSALEERAGTEPRPYWSIVVHSSGPPRMPASTGVQQAVRSSGPMWSSAPTKRRGRPPRPPGPAAQSRASAAWMGGHRGREHPQSVQQPRTIPQSAFGRQLLLRCPKFFAR